MSDLESLISMGFSQERAEEALTETDNAGIELALEWLHITDVIDVVNDKKEGCTPKSGEKSLDSHFEEKAQRVPRETRATSNSSKVSASSSNETRILVRLLNGKQLSKTFNAKDKLNDILLWIQSLIPAEQFGLMTNFPKKVFTCDDYKQSLDALNLVPSAVLITTQPDKWNDLKVYRGGTSDVDEKRRAEEKKRKEEVEKQFKEREEERLALERVRLQIQGDKDARRQRWPSLYENSDGQPSGNQKR